MCTIYRAWIFSLLTVALLNVTQAASPDSSTFFANSGALEQYLLDNSELGEEPDDAWVVPQTNHSWRLELHGMHSEPGEDGNSYHKDVFVFLDYRYSDGAILGGSGRIAGITFCKAPPRDRPGCYGKPPLSKDQERRAGEIARHFIALRVPLLLTRTHETALAAYRKNRKTDAADASAKLANASPWEIVPVTASNVDIYNDLGFFLEEGGKFKEALQVLQEVTKAVPDRAVAHLNLGDAYVGLSDTSHARESFQTYQKLMKAAGKEAKIPKRIQKYLDQ
jgi:tetratricopeptide (TPR) repeat protein